MITNFYAGAGRMADIFISFKTSDTARVTPIRDGFLARGLSVFWSNDIAKDSPDYHAVLIKEIKQAGVVVVAWTENSVGSHPVAQECAQATRDGKLMQVELDEIEPIRFPMEAGFKAQKTRLIGWMGDRQHPEWIAMVAAIEVRLLSEYKRRLAQAEASAPQSQQPISRRAPEHESDWLAGSESDADRVTPGIAFEKIDPVLAIPACERAIREHPGERRFLFQLGRALQASKLPADHARAYSFYKKAEEAGSAAAMSNLGRMHRDGKGVAKDGAEAVRWFRKGADAGSADAMSNLAWMYDQGRGVKKDAAEAATWRKKAEEAEKG